jgi:hypothetical protein
MNMKNRFVKLFACGAALFALAITGCSDDDNNNGPTAPVNPVTEGRWITVAGARMQTNPGDGNGGTVVYAISKEDAQNPDIAVNAYDNGTNVLSTRTARLQSSVDGTKLFNITYTGANGGTFMTYDVNGGSNFAQSDVTVNISQYASASPRWVKLFDGDNTGVAVNVTAPTPVVTNNVYQRTRGTATVLSLNLKDVLISDYRQFEIPLTPAEEALGHHIFRLDAPTLNAAGDKLIIGTWMRKTNPAAPGENEAEFERLGSKSVIVDYPSLQNPTVITSTVAFGDTSGYRSFNSFVGNDGNIYQATQRDADNGSYILKINQSNQYDNSYVFSLDTALGVAGTYIDAWRYAGNGIAYVAYTYTNAPNEQGFLARVDLNAKTAQRVEGIEYDPELNFGQYQGFVVDGNELYVAITPVGKDGNIYVIDIPTGAVKKGAKLVNKPGNHYIGVF